jgi:hypothetical protein
VSFVRGARHSFPAFGLASLLAGITVVGLIGWAWDRPRLATGLVSIIVVLVLLEGSFRVFTSARGRADTLEAALAFLHEPHLVVEVEGVQFMHFHEQPDEGGNYAILKVSADREVANCRGHIKRIVTAGNEIPVHAPIPLRWIAWESLSQDLVPGMSYGMTVVFTESTRPTETLISTDSHEPRGIPWALNPGDSRLTIVVSADEVPPLELVLRVRSYGDWRTLTMTEDDGAPFERHPASLALGVQTGATGPYDRARERELVRGMLAAGSVPYNPATAPNLDVAGVSSTTASSLGLVPDYRLRAEPLRVTRAVYGSPGKEVDVTQTLNALVEEGVILDFIADNATLVEGKDPAPGEQKTLRVRWTEFGVGKASAFTEGTHIVIPDPK